MNARFRVLDVDVTLAGPDELVEPVAIAYRRFRAAHDDPPAMSMRIEAVGDPARAIRVDGRDVAIVPELGAAAQLYRTFLTTVLDGVRSHAVFHGAAVATPDGRAALLSAPTGHGKSSLTLELVRRGLLFLSDDYAPVDLVSGEVAPYPRTVSVLPGGTAPLPPQVRDAAVRPGAPTLFGKTLLDVADVFGEQALVRGSLPLRTVVVLVPSGDADDPLAARTSIDVGVREGDAEAVAGRLRSIEGVTLELEHRSGGLRLFRVSLDPARRPSEPLSALLEGDEVVWAEKFWDSGHDFDAPPRAEPIARRQAAMYLVRELLNRRKRSRFLEGRDGGPAGLLLDVAGALADAACWRVEIGRFDETATLVETLVRAGSDPARRSA